MHFNCLKYYNVATHVNIYRKTIRSIEIHNAYYILHNKNPFLPNNKIPVYQIFLLTWNISLIFLR